VAVATGANQIVASSFSALLVHLKRKDGLICACGSVLWQAVWSGAAAGVTIFNYLKSLGQVDLLVNLLLRRFPGIIGGLMLVNR